MPFDARLSSMQTPRNAAAKRSQMRLGPGVWRRKITPHDSVSKEIAGQPRRRTTRRSNPHGGTGRCARQPFRPEAQGGPRARRPGLPGRVPPPRARLARVSRANGTGTFPGEKRAAAVERDGQRGVEDRHSGCRMVIARARERPPVSHVRKDRRGHDEPGVKRDVSGCEGWQTALDHQRLQSGNRGRHP